MTHEECHFFNVYAILWSLEKYINTDLKLLLSHVVMQVYAHAGAALDGKMYITCGRRGEDYLKELQCYDPKTDRWEVLADGPERRAWHGMAALLGKLYVIGGSNNDSGYRRDVHQVRPYHTYVLEECFLQMLAH